MRRALRWLLVLLGVLLWIGFISVSYRGSTHVGEGATARLTIGLWFSPWYEYTSTDSGFSQAISPLSWSAACGVGAWLCFWSRRRLKPA